MRIISFFVLFFCLIGFDLQSQTVEYYRRMSMDDRQYTYSPHEKIDSAIARKTNCYKVTFDEEKRIKYIRYEKLGKQAVGRRKISFIRFSYSDSLEIRFFDYPIPTETNRIHSQHLILNSDKIPIAVVFYDKNGKITKDDYGISRYERILNDEGWMVECRFYDETGNRITNNNGDYYYRYEWKNDSIFYRPELSYYDEHDNLHNGKRGYSVVKMAFYKEGERLPYEERYFDAQLQPALCAGGYAIYRKAYYKNGLLKTELFLDGKEKPINDKSGFCRIEYEYNKYGNRATFNCYMKDVDKKYLKCKIEYDKDQKVTKRLKEWKSE